MDASQVSTQTGKGSGRSAKLKLALLYILIGGLVVSALISVTAILIGQFNDAVVKALVTTLLLVVHSLFILALVAADKNNTIGKSLLPTTILAVSIADLITSVLGLWNIWPAEYSGRAFLLYGLLIGAAFIITGVTKLKVANKPTLVVVNTTLAFVAVLTLALVPWIVAPDSSIVTAFYFRLTGALAILAATALSISAILNRIAVSHKHTAVKIARPKTLTGAMLAINICVGVLVAFIWLFGLGFFIASAARSNMPEPTVYPSSYYYN
jgi:hypothetical protein